MKTLGIIILVINSFFLLSFLKTKDKNSLTEDNLKGKVKTLTESVYKATDNFGEIKKGKLKDKRLYKYNDKGNNIEERDYNSQGAYWQYCIIKYNDKGEKIENNMYDSEDRSLSGKVIYKYDDNENLIEKSDYGSKGTLIRKIIINKNYENGNKMESSWYDPDGSLSYKYNYKYDERGNQIEVNSYQFVFTFTYVDKLYKVDYHGKLDHKYSYKYDNRGNLIEEQRYFAFDDSTDILTFRYDNFDKMGNWLIKIEFRNNIPNDLTERELEYY